MEQLKPPVNIHLLALFGCYLILRVLFQQFPALKELFIFPTGYVIQLFYGFGDFNQSEWIFNLNSTQFILGESCSGTTFFSLLISYFVYRRLSMNISYAWIAWAFPITLIANTMRVLSSIYMHGISSALDMQGYNSEIHVITGTAAFLSSFLLIAYIIETPQTNENHELQSEP